MARSVSELMSGVRSLCKVGVPPTEPTQEGLSDSDILSAINDEETSLTEEQVLSSQNQWLQCQPLGTPARDFMLTVLDFNEVVQIQYQVDPVYDRWETIDNVNKVQIDQCENEGKLAWAIYGTPPNICFSFVPSVSLPTMPMRMWYETSPSDQLPAQSPRLNPAFHGLLKYSAAIVCREIHMALPVHDTLHALRLEKRAQFERYANRSPDQRSRAKSPAYGSSVVDGLHEPYGLR